MNEITVYLLAIEVRKWDQDSKKINFTAFTAADNKEFRLLFTVSITNPADMVEELLGKIKKINKEKLNKEYESSSFDLSYSNEHYLRQKLYNYFKRVMNELTNPKKKKSQRGIFTVRYDIYSEGQDISFLPVEVQFFVYVNWTRKYYEREQYIKVMDPLRKALELNPNFATGYKWMGRSLMKLRKIGEAQKYFEKYAEVAKSFESYLELAHCYRKSFNYELAEKLYTEILAKDENNIVALISLAQINYALNKPYKEILDNIYQQKEDFVKNWLLKEWDFRFLSDKKTRLTAIDAAEFLGLPSVFELSQKAFKGEIPAHFNAAKARLIFYKEELDNWIQILSTYNCLPKWIKVNEKALKKKKLQLVEVVIGPGGVHIPKEEFVVPESAEVKEEIIDPQKPKHTPNVEEIIARFNKEAVIKIENEDVIFEQISNGAKTNSPKKKTAASGKKTATKGATRKEETKTKTKSGTSTKKKQNKTKAE